MREEPSKNCCSERSGKACGAVGVRKADDAEGLDRLAWSDRFNGSAAFLPGSESENLAVGETGGDLMDAERLVASGLIAARPAEPR